MLAKKILTFLLSAYTMLIFLALTSSEGTPEPFSIEALTARHFARSRGFREQMIRGLPEIDNDIPSTGPHPTPRDHVKTAIIDALQLALVTLALIDNDDTIFPYYFARNDKGRVKQVYEAVAGDCGTGNGMLSHIHVQATDIDPPDCRDTTVAFLHERHSDRPILILCNFNYGKPYTTNYGVTGNLLATCDEVTASGHVGYAMYTRGATFLHEYLHFQKLVNHIYGGRTIDDQLLYQGQRKVAYGPHATYDNLNKKFLARINADSYAWYALQVFWTQVCNFNFAPPREGLDDDGYETPPDSD
ncbi:MAG: hypothetical protein L6R37_000244 [Teloschistes peruensis]|nr:MAG: hypothetical protein L6R37_000244 [Teloschistes peruensis]